MQVRAISMKDFDPQVIHSYPPLLAKKIIFLPFLAAILHFCINAKAYLFQNWCESNFDKTLPPKYGQSDLPLFSKNSFPNIFGSHLEFLHKTQKHFFLRNSVRKSDFDKIFDPQGYTHSHLALFAQNYFPAIFGGHLEFLRKSQKCNYLRNGAKYSEFKEMFGPPGYPGSSDTFARNCLPAIFTSHLEFLHKMQKRIYLRNSAR